jgi:EAL domain-containing protein (putative c-di-GMP-specific phosphodiesterase class I)
VCINLAAKQFEHPDLVQDVDRILQKTGLNPPSLNLEITESVVMENTQSTFDTFRKIKALGIGLVIDDFGNGYSSLSYLKYFLVNRLKIGRSFTRSSGR